MRQKNTRDHSLPQNANWVFGRTGASTGPPLFRGQCLPSRQLRRRASRTRSSRHGRRGSNRVSENSDLLLRVVGWRACASLIRFPWEMRRTRRCQCTPFIGRALACKHQRSFPELCQVHVDFQNVGGCVDIPMPCQRCATSVPAGRATLYVPDRITSPRFLDRV